MVCQGKTLATAESCTSGRISSMLTSIDGASEYFLGGIIAYQNEIKIERLGVSASDIQKYDVVSKQVAEQMVRGACAFFQSDYAIASTGYTGRGTAQIPSGTIWIAWGNETEQHSTCLTENLGREKNTQNATETALTEFYGLIHNA